MMMTMMKMKMYSRHDKHEWWCEQSLGLVQSEHSRKLS